MRDAHHLLSELFTEGQRWDEGRADVPAIQLTALFLGATPATINGWLVDPDEARPLDERSLLTHRVFWSEAASTP